MRKFVKKRECCHIQHGRSVMRGTMKKKPVDDSAMEHGSQNKMIDE